MEQVFSWRKAAIGSIAFHIILGSVIGLIGWQMSQSMQNEAYEIDLSVQMDQVVQAEAVHFAPPLAQDVLNQRMENLQGSVGRTASGGNGEAGGGTSSHTLAETTAPAYGATPGSGTLAVASGTGVGEGNGVAGAGEGAGTGLGEGTGTGDGFGSGQGEGVGDGSGSAEGAGGYFDGDGFWSAVNSQKSYPAQAIKRGMEGDATVRVELDGEGNLISAYIVSSSGTTLLDRAAIKAVEQATPYPNESGVAQTIDVPISFRLTD
ncbi:energy transducer TonB [uncultured Veillonella sp.]|uniref:energy transducer TonB n=1 Tax=uncultured Veillonella sp. TaxID=159268 RepID=UPI002602C9A2|nr:energy transducer TonB [uncultured Veillonella sp.]